MLQAAWLRAKRGMGVFCALLLATYDCACFCTCAKNPLSATLRFAQTISLSTKGVNLCRRHYSLRRTPQLLAASNITCPQGQISLRKAEYNLHLSKYNCGHSPSFAFRSHSLHPLSPSFSAKNEHKTLKKYPRRTIRSRSSLIMSCIVYKFINVEILTFEKAQIWAFLQKVRIFQGIFVKISA